MSEGYAEGGGDVVDETRGNSTNYSEAEAKQKRANRVRRGGKGSVSGKMRDINVRVTGLRKPGYNEV